MIILYLCFDEKKKKKDHFRLAFFLIHFDAAVSALKSPVFSLATHGPTCSDRFSRIRTPSVAGEYADNRRFINTITNTVPRDRVDILFLVSAVVEGS